MLSHACTNCATTSSRSFSDLSTLALLDFHNIGTCLSLNAHHVLLNEGFVADRVFVICSGRVKLIASSADGRLLILRVAGPGEILGLASLLQNSRYRVTAVTLGLCTIKSIPRAEFIRFMDTFIDVGRSTAMAMARDYNAAILSARRLALSNSAAGKLASALLDWARMDHLDDSPAHTNLPISFPMPLTHEELGSMAGIARETVTRLLSKFRQEGLIDQVDEQMVLHHPDQLESLYC